MPNDSDEGRAGMATGAICDPTGPVVPRCGHVKILGKGGLAAGHPEKSLRLVTITAALLPQKVALSRKNLPNGHHLSAPKNKHSHSVSLSVIYAWDQPLAAGESVTPRFPA